MERPLPRVCRCANGGTCVVGADGALSCVCRTALAGPRCEEGAAAAARAASPAAVLVPVLLALLLALAAAAAWFVIRKKPL